MNFIIDGEDIKLENKYKVCVLIHLYYEDTIHEYEKYIKNIPENIDILFTYSNIKVYQQLVRLVSKAKNKIFWIDKKNHGRDISAWLVAARTQLLQYDVVCVVHDKKSKNKMLEHDTDEWIYSLWENTLSSKQYIENIISVFEGNSKIGILTPPLYLGEFVTSEYINQWGLDYPYIVELFERTDVKTIPSYNSFIKSFGTVFWARTDAIKKLLNYKWKYEDFDEEPLPDDGTLSHAIERSICFYAEDAGYESHTVMTKQYADIHIQRLQDVLFCSLNAISMNLGCKYVSEIKNYGEYKQEIKIFCSKYKKIYIYGAGAYGKACLSILRIINVCPEAFIVSSDKNDERQIESVRIIGIQDCDLNDDVGIIVASSNLYRSEMLDALREKEVHENNIYIYKHDKF